MTEVAVNSLVEKLLELGRENVELITGVQDDVNDLVADLKILSAFLKDASKIDRDTDHDWKQLLKEIRIVVFKAEDSIDKFLVQAKRHQDFSLVAKLIDLPYRIKVKNAVKEIQSIMDKVKELQVKYKHLLEATQLNNLPRTTPQPRQLTLLDEDDVVGRDEEANIVIGRLIHGSNNLEAVTIVGMPGLGKSTLARKVYKDSRISFEFFSCIWVNVSRSYNKTEVLLNILKNFTQQLDNKSDEQITDEICMFLRKGGRCLIILDDVWSGDIIDFVKHVFPDNNKGHRIMLTSQLEEVASCFNHEFHKLTFLSHENSWLLLRLKVFRKECCPLELEETGHNIAKKCSGLPLAVVVIAGALAGRKTRREWQFVYDNMGDYLINRDDPNSCFSLIKTTYNLLPYYQKACFLYCASFPQAFEIPCWKLIRLWIAEGFMPSQKHFTLEDEAEYCLTDLTKKNLLMVMEQSLDGRIKTCRIHDVLYDFCKKEASEEDIVQVIRNTPDHQSSLVMTDLDMTCRRLCIDSSALNNFLEELPKKPPMENIKSFLYFSSKPIDNPTPTMIRSLNKGFPLIKVLDIEPITFIFSNYFFQLLHLKYISLSGDFKSLPQKFAKFWNLETLIIHTTNKDSTFEVRADIWSMMHLRHLHVNVPTILPPPRASTSKERECNIQTLSVIIPQSCTKVTRARYLRKLAIRGRVFALFDNNASGLSKLAMLKRLEKLKIVNEDQDVSRVITLPVMVFILPNTLRKLTLSNTRLSWSDMTKLGQLESLEVLKLRQNAFSGAFWETEIGGFTSLLVLWIEKTNLRIWRASCHNFPSLKRLVLIQCDELEEVPQGLADIPDLQEIELVNTSNAVKSARIIANKKLEGYASSVIRFRLSVSPPNFDADDSN